MPLVVGRNFNLVKITAVELKFSNKTTVRSICVAAIECRTKDALLKRGLIQTAEIKLTTTRKHTVESSDH